MSAAKPCRNCGHNKTLHRWDYRVQQCQVGDEQFTKCPCTTYLPPRKYARCDRCGSVRTLQHHCDLTSRIKAFAKDCVTHGDMTPAGQRMLDRILDGER